MSISAQQAKELQDRVKGKKPPVREKYTAAEYKSEFIDKTPAIQAKSYSGKEKIYIELILKELGLAVCKDYRFAPPRRWKFDYAVVFLKVAVEYEGLFSKKSRHTSAKGYTGDCDKYNMASELGWKLYRYTALNYRNIESDMKRELGLE